MVGFCLEIFITIVCNILTASMHKVIEILEDEPATKSPESSQPLRGEISSKRPFYQINFDYFLNNPLDLSTKEKPKP